MNMATPRLIGFLMTILILVLTKVRETEHLQFDKLVKSKHFVDRSLFIKEFIEKPSRVIIATPRGFGKSSNMDMLRRFAQPELHSNGTMKSNPASLKNYRLFSETIPTTGKHLKIFQDKKFFNTHFGKHPVIHLDFSSLEIKSSEQDFKDLLKNKVLRNAYEQHIYLLESPKLRDEEREVIEHFLGPADTNPYLASEGVFYLQKFLFAHFNKTKCIMLIDDLDAPIKNMVVEKSLPGSSIKSLLTYLQGFCLNTLKDFQLPIHSILITACTPMAAELTKELESIKYVAFTNEESPLVTYFRLAQYQVDMLARSEKLEKRDSDNIRLWYGGYRVDITGEEFYNIQSIVGWFSARKFQPYWISAAPVEVFESMFLPRNLGMTLRECAQGKNVTIDTGGLKYDLYGILELKEAALRNLEMDFKPRLKSRGFFLQFMYDEGYFTKIGKGVNDTDIYKAPNFEVRKILERLVFEGRKATQKTNPKA